MTEGGSRGMVSAALVVIIAVAVALAAILGWSYSRSHPSDKLIERAIESKKAEIERSYADRVRDLEAQVRGYRKLAVESRLKYKKLKDLIAEKAREAKEIQEPKDEKETRDRFARLGYPSK